ncbi:DNA polymerase [Lacunimicrobium album]
MPKVHPPFRTGKGTLLVAFYASAELGCMLELGWELPEHVLDLYVEFRNLTNGRSDIPGSSLLEALQHFGHPSMDVAYKEAIRERIIACEEFNPCEQEEVLKYCWEDVEALRCLLDSMVGGINLGQALMRGDYAKAVANMERRGTPVDLESYQRIQRHTHAIRNRLTSGVGPASDVFEHGCFRTERFLELLARQRITWPFLPSGVPCLDDDTFKRMALRYPNVIGPLREARKVLRNLSSLKLAVGADGRNRCLLSPFRSKTGRNQPSSTKFVFGLARSLRTLIRPEPGQFLAYIDYCQQEFGIGAALSRDQNMIRAYNSGDCYLEFAKQAKAIPQSGTRHSHPHERELFKACVLGVQYGMGAKTLALQIGKSEEAAKELLGIHRKVYPQFWRWSDGAVDHASVYGNLQTIFGWTLHVDARFNPRSVRNFPCQANGAEILRHSCTGLVKRGIGLCAPIHDAVLTEGEIDRAEDIVRTSREIMEAKSHQILQNLRLRTDVNIIRYPNRFDASAGNSLWERLEAITTEIEQEEAMTRIV